ncbi:MAG: glutathione S-transferase family protein [Azospirillum brasilense]|nr:MAG: glutathione S-transferase family protein [Azospirillum brasilense]
MSEQPILYGASYSVYVRAVRLALAEKGVPYTLVPVDVFAPGGPPADYLARQPFGRIPAFEHGSFRLYEAGAIMRYVDEAFTGPSLQPEGAEARARTNQVISILDSYAYPSLVRSIFVERVSVPKRGQIPDEAKVQAAIPMATTCLKALADIRGTGPFLAGSVLTLADLHAIPMFAYFHATPEAEDLLRPHAGLREWWQRLAERPSVLATAT